VKDYRAYLLDLDGVFYRGAQLLPGAREFVAWLDATDRDYRYLSNNSMQSPEEVAARLRRLGVPAPDFRVLTASQAAITLLAERWPGAPVWIVGLPPLRQMAARAGLRVLNLRQGDAPDDPAVGAETARVVLVGLDRSLTYEGLRLATRAVLAGAELLGINRDPQLPMEDGFDPGCGAILAALEVATRRPATIVGKPAPTLLLTAIAAMQADPTTTVMVGDAIEMDIAAGQRAGIDTILVLSGLTDAQHAAIADPTPTYVLRDLAAILATAQGAA
jgi:HAD superfamily hydrolase (TIGR01450 family)